MHDSTRRQRKWRDALIPFTLFSLFALQMSLALSAPALADPPGRVGRLAWQSTPGSLTLDNQGRGESFRPGINQPLTGGDVLRTERNARAELQIGSMTLRLDGGTTLELARIDDERVSVYLRDGHLIVKLAAPETAGEFELTTPNGRFTADPTAREASLFRVDTDGNGSSATTYFGALRFAANDADVVIAAGQRADFGYAGPTRYRWSTPTRDEFMHWSAARDREAPPTVSSRYVSPEMTGAEDLDAWGDWAEVPEYGPIWTPRIVAADWAPYRTGRWVWVSPWGWNWVGDEPWGFAPFHYGRWVQYRGRWAWVPGERIARPVYAPALVAWNPAPGVNIDLSFGRPPAAGWFPLAPHQAFAPYYRSSPDYVRRLNRAPVAHIDHRERFFDDRRAGFDRPMPERERPRPDRDWRPRPDSGPQQPLADWRMRPDDHRRDRQEDRHESRNDDRHDRPHPEQAAAPFDRAPQTRPQPLAPPSHPDLAFSRPSEPARGTNPAPAPLREARGGEPHPQATADARPNTPRSERPDDDRRRHRRPSEGTEGR